MRVEFVSPHDHSPTTGIGRYSAEMMRFLSARMHVSARKLRSLPFSHRLSTLKSLPIGIENHVEGSIVHFTHLVGSAMMLWNPVHPAIVSVHDLGVLVCSADEQLFNRFDRTLLDVQLAGLRRMDRFLVHSNFTRQGLIEHLGIPQERISVTPTWIDVEHFHPAPHSRQIVAQRFGLNLDDGIPTLAYVGSELPRKNLGLLLRAMAITKGRGRPIRLLKIGAAGGERWRLAFEGEVERLGLSREVVMMGVVSEEDLPVLISAADICVTSTLLESTIPWVTLSAMACGRPSIVTTPHLIPPDVQEAVIVVSPHCPEELATAIETLADDAELRQQMGDIGRKRIMAYNGESMIEGLLQAYARLQ